MIEGEERFAVVHWRAVGVVSGAAGIGVVILESVLAGVFATVAMLTLTVLVEMLLAKDGRNRHAREAERQTETSRRRGLSDAEQAMQNGDQTTLYEFE